MVAPVVEVIVQVWIVRRSHFQQELPCIVNKTALHFIDSDRDRRMLAEYGQNSFLATYFGHNVSNV